LFVDCTVVTASVTPVKHNNNTNKDAVFILVYVMYVCMYVYMYVCIYAFIYLCIYFFIYFNFYVHFTLFRYKKM
jgi:hypothetical protein